MALRQGIVGFLSLIGLLVQPSFGSSETIWSGGTWRLDKGNPEADDDSVFLCSLSARGNLPGFRIVAYDNPNEASFEISIQDDSLGPTGSRTFPISIGFDRGAAQKVSGTYVQEFGSVGGQLPDFASFLEDFAGSAKMTVESDPTGSLSVSLKGSRAAATAFQNCLGYPTPPGKAFVNSEFYYGSRAGMSATVTDEVGLNTGLAEIKITHTRAAATSKATFHQHQSNVSINSGERIYHVPGQHYYDVTKISAKFGERFFCSEIEAQAAGWRKARS